MSSKIKISALIFAIIISVGTSSLKTTAQSASPQMVITWQTYGSYIPPQYKDKALPNQESKLTASLSLLSSGKLIDLSDQTIYWYLDDTLIDTGINEQNIVFSPFGTPPAFLTLKAELPSYHGGLLVHEVQIPLVGPKAVIELPHPSGQLSGNPITLQGTPYFFYVSDPGMLSYSWSVNGQTSASAENPETLQINLDPSTPSGSSFTASLSITNPNDSLSSDDSTSFIYVKQL